MMDCWLDYMPQIVTLCRALDLANPATYDSGHPLLLAIDRTMPGMSKADCHFVENVIGFYAAALPSREEGMR